MRVAKASKRGIKAISKDRRTSAANVLARYERVLEGSFTPRERELLRKKGIRLVVGDIDEDSFKASGCYVGRRLGKHTICLDDSKPMDEETMIHETIHILQEIDPERPVFEKSLGKTSEDVNLKEALTEAETLSRTSRLNIDDASYYEGVRRSRAAGRRSPISLKRRDRGTFRKDKKAAGSHAHNVHENFLRSEIQFLVDPISGKTARSTFIRKRKGKGKR